MLSPVLVAQLILKLGCFQFYHLAKLSAENGHVDEPLRTPDLAESDSCGIRCYGNFAALVEFD